jgi:hypothetical protein
MSTENPWLSQIDADTVAYQALLAHLTIDQLNWKPNPETWSIAQILDHLILGSQSYFPLVEQIKAGNYNMPWSGRFPILVRFFGRFLVSSLQPDRKRKMKTFPVWEPSTSTIEEGILERFVAQQDQLKNLIQEVVAGNLLEKVVGSPANGFIVYTLKSAFDILVVHEKRHLEQAKEVVALLPTQQV